MSEQEKILIRPVTTMSLELIRFDGDNPNIMLPVQMDALKENIRKYGFTSPVVVDSHGIVADGEHRVQAAREIGLTEIPVIVLDNISESDRKIIRQVMNKLKGTHDIEKDILELQKITGQGVTVLELASLLGQQQIEVEALIGLATMPVKEKDVTDIASEHTCPKCGFNW